MRTKTHKNFTKPRRRRRGLRPFFLALILMAIMLGTQTSVLVPQQAMALEQIEQSAVELLTAQPPAAVPAAPPTAALAAPVANAPLAALVPMTLTVTDYPTGTAVINSFSYIINEDNSGDPDALSFDDWPYKALESYSPVVATGVVTPGTPHNGTPGTYEIEVPDVSGRYLISVRANYNKDPDPGYSAVTYNNGINYKMGGAYYAKDYTHYDFADNDRVGSLVTTNDTDVTVELVPEPLPVSTLRVQVFEDNHPVNGEHDIPIEGPPANVEDFHVVVEDTAGEVIVNWDDSGAICGDRGADNTGICRPDATGLVEVHNLPRGKYELKVIPPDGSGWIQTSTIEGTPVIDAWLQEGGNGNIEFQLPHSFGFVKLMDNWEPGPNNPNTIQGTIKTALEWLPPVAEPAPLGRAVDQPFIALTDIGGNDNQVYLGRGEPDGSFVVNDVPDGLYQMAIWDKALDYIIFFTTVQFPNTTTCLLGSDSGEVNTSTLVNMNLVPNPAYDSNIDPPGLECLDRTGFGIPRWYGTLEGTVFLDNGIYDGNPVNLPAKRNNFRDCTDPNDPTTCEIGLPGVEVLMRFRDGTMRYGGVTDGAGGYAFSEIFQLGRFYVTEVGFGHLGASGAYLHDRFAHNPLVDYSDRFTGALTVANLNWAGKVEKLDWGKFNYEGDENGGISGIVQYATTRNEFEAKLQATEDYEPGVPNVTVNLYEINPLFDPEFPPHSSTNPIAGALLNTTETDAWEQPTGCALTDKDGNSDPPFDQTESAGVAAPLGPDCVEAPNLSNEIKDGLFDGGYAFEERYVTPGVPGSGFMVLPPDDYVVEVVPPPGYKIVTEEDLNTDDGNALVAIPPSGCVGDLYQPQVPDLYDSPYDAYYDPNYTPDPGGYKPDRSTLYMPKCNLKSVTLEHHQNKGTDFHLMADNATPIPARIFGVLLDDVNVTSDPTQVFYGEKAGIAHTNVAIRDHTGRLIKMIKSDEHGFYETLVPSTFSANCPTPSGVCPAMYQIVGNDPGDPDKPWTWANYNPSFQSRYFWKEMFPGKTTFFDLALIPLAPQQANCTLPDTTPQLHYVSQPYGPDTGTSITLTGNGFGPTPTVEIGGVSVTVTGAGDLDPNTVDTITIDTTGVPAGPHQLLVKADGITSTVNSLTFHVIGTGYASTPVHVTDLMTLADIQTEIDNAAEGTVIVFEPGEYTFLSEPLPDRFDLTNNVQLQGYGPGDPASPTGLGGSVIDLSFNIGANGLTVAGNRPEVGDPDPLGNLDDNPRIDGFLIHGSRDNELFSGAIKVNHDVDSLQISNNIIRSNGGGYGGGTTIGEPYRLDGFVDGDNDNNNVRIHHNRYLHNGGFFLAGAIGIYTGADDYEIDNNDICGNYSFEYGGGISHYGLSHNGQIHHNRVYYNGSFDEGGGIIIAGELPAAGVGLTRGSGNVDIYNNLVQGNMSNDDGGGIRTLQPLDYSIDIVNNIIVNNVATDVGGGIALDDASEVTIVNNTIARNSSTATAEDAMINVARGAGITSESYSPQFEAYLGIPEDSGYPDPVMFNNLICENQAYTYDWINMVFNFDGIIDMEVLHGPTNSEFLNPVESLLTEVTPDYDPSNGACSAYTPNDPPTDPDFPIPPGSDSLRDLFDSPYHNILEAITFRAEPNFVTVYNLTALTNLGDSGDYHILAGSDAEDEGVTIVGDVAAPCDDYDDELRGEPWDIGADEIANDTPGTCADGAVRSFSLTPADPADVIANATLGEVVVFNHTVVNTGDVADTYNLTVTVTTTDALDWTTNTTIEPLQTAALDPGQMALVTVTVPVPSLAISGTVATATVVAATDALPLLTRSVTDTITVITTPVVILPQADIYMSFSQGRILRLPDGCATGPTCLENPNPSQAGPHRHIRDEDIVGWVNDGSNGGQGSYVMVFDGSAAGVFADLNAFDILDDNSILMSFQAVTTIPGLGSVDDSDVVLFTPTAFGKNATAGTFSMFLEGLAVGLTTNGEDIDAIHLLEGDMLLISTVGNINVSGASGKDEDLLLYTMDDPDTWERYFDGSEVALDTNSGEDVVGTTVTEDVIYLSTLKDFEVAGLTGASNTIFSCNAPTPDTEPGGTACGGFSNTFIGSNHGVPVDSQDRSIDAFDIP